MQQDDLDNMLMRRAAAPKAPSGLAERIITQALLNMPRVTRKSFWEELGFMFALPHPRVAIAAGVILGIAMGVQAGDGLTMLQQDWSSFLYINEGGWL